jgi:hypothetical protein
VGSHLEYATAYFPGRTRKQIKRKFRIEDKKDPERVDRCIRNQREIGTFTLVIRRKLTYVDVQYLAKATGYQVQGDMSAVNQLFAEAEKDKDRAKNEDMGIENPNEEDQQLDPLGEDADEGENAAEAVPDHDLDVDMEQSYENNGEEDNDED